jgi:hypothetical protein
MEYEIEDVDVLFDASTNPSLIRRWSLRVKRPFGSARPRALQKAVAIPEEEEQPA